MYKLFSCSNIDTITKKLQDRYSNFENSLSSLRVLDYNEIKKTIPELDQAMLDHSLIVKDIFLFQTTPYKITEVHVDLDKETFPNFALNWPIFNCNNTTMNFYNVDNADGVVKYNPSYNQYFKIFNPEQSILLDSLELTAPYLVNVGAAHNINNSLSTHRLIVSIRFDSTKYSDVN